MKNRNRKGAVLPLIAVSMVTLILLLGLMVELNWLYSTRFEAQSASDLSTRSALAKLYDQGQLNGGAVNQAKDFGVHIYGLNFNRSAPITSNDLAFGEIDDNDEFQEIRGGGPNLRNITASRVEFSQHYTTMLGTLIAKNEIDLGVFSVAEATQVNMVLSLDASRSMNRSARSEEGEWPPGVSNSRQPPVEGSRWFALREAVANFIPQLEAKNIDFGLVTFGGGLAGGFSSPLDADFSRIEAEIDSATVTGPVTLGVLDRYTGLPALGKGTSIYDGIADSTTVLLRRDAPGQRFIILFTDGSQSVQGERPDELVAAREAAAEGIVIFTIGYDVDEPSLDEIASITGGQAFSVNSPEELADALSKIVSFVHARIVQ